MLLRAIDGASPSQEDQALFVDLLVPGREEPETIAHGNVAHVLRVLFLEVCVVVQVNKSMFFGRNKEDGSSEGVRVAPL